MKKLLSVLALASLLAFCSCDTSSSSSFTGEDSGDDSCDQELIDNITLTTMICTNWSTLGYASYDACKADKNDQILDLFLLCKIKDDNSDENK